MTTEAVTVSKGPWKYRPQEEAKRIAAGVAAVEQATGRRVGSIRCPDGYEFIFKDVVGSATSTLDLNEWDRRG
jgi:hypothetical protein